MNLLLAALAISLVSGVAGALLGRSRDGSANGFWLGALLGPIGWLLILVRPTQPPTPKSPPVGGVP